jgi:hypothetical protein
VTKFARPLPTLTLLAALTLGHHAAGAPPAAKADLAQNQAPTGITLENDPDDTAPPPPIPPLPPRLPGSADYAACMDRLGDDPSGALVFADKLAAAGETQQARHCQALAEIELGNLEKGAGLLDTLAQDLTLPAASRAEILGEAANAWNMADNTAQALADASSAIAFEPDDPDLEYGFAIAAEAAGGLGKARAALDSVLATDPGYNAAHSLRARIAREQGDFGQSERDINAAIKADPDDTAALRERGILRQRKGDLTGARADWEQIIANDEDSDDADQAEQYLALLDAGG